MKSKILFVGGIFDLEGGRPSGVVNKFASELDNVTLYNGGNYNDLQSIIESVINYDVVFWWAHTEDNLKKINNVKDYNFKTMLITAKRNDHNEHTFQEILQSSFESKANLTIEFSKENELFKMRLFDPLGNLWYEGFSIPECVNKLKERLEFIKGITRESTTSDEENKGALAWFFNMFKEEMYKSDELPQVNECKRFIDIVKKYSTRFYEETFQTKDIKRFLGNASLRCPKGFPSFRDGKYIFVSRRNVNKEFITIEDFIPTYLKNNKVYYCGDYKPSVDTPIQLRLYDKLKNINYMIHSHCYIKTAPYTEVALPCGAIEEVSEILKVIEKYYEGDYTKDLYLINLKGHGSIMMSNNLDKLNEVEVIGRKIPELM